MQIPYPIWKKNNKQQKPRQKRNYFISCKSVFRQSGIFSLLLFALVGIFFASISHASQTKKLDVTATEIYTATFSFNFLDFAPRTDIVPDRVYFNASGTLGTFSPVPAYIAGFSSWANNYSTSAWTAPQNYSSPVFSSSIQAGQVPSVTSSNFTPGHLVMSRIGFAGTWNLEFSTFSSDSNFVSTPASGRISMGVNVPLKPHALIISKTRLYLFWLGADNKIHMREHNGTVPSDEVVFTNTDTDPTYGLGGCLVSRGGNEYITITYAKSQTEINVASFLDGNLSSVATQTFIVPNIFSNHTDICQNPRSGLVYLSWLNNETQYYLKSSTVGNFDFAGAPSAISGNWRGNYGMSIEGFNNFEMDFALPATFAAGDSVSNIILKPADSTLDTFSPNGNPQIFPYSSGNNHYAGLLILNGFTEFSFRKRLLNFPQQFEWQKSAKLLHLQGPPIKDTLVSAEVDFAEIATGSCLAQTTNAAGGRTPFAAQTNVIASSGNLISLVFDKTMNLNASLIGNQIQLLAPDNSARNLLLNTILPQEIRFRLNEDLAFDTSYRVTIASDVLDANGSQIWSDTILSFKTQKSVSNLLASEVTSISVFSDAGRTIAIDGTEVNATSTVYLRINAVDPAFNTIDTATVSVVLNGNPISQITLTQPSPASTILDGAYSISAPHGGNNLYEFISPSSTIKTSVRVDFPTISSVSPVDGSTGVLINKLPQLVFSENLLAASVNSTSVTLKRGGTAAGYSVSVAGNTITIDPNDSSENYLLTDTLYEIAAGYGIKDQKGNPFVTSPATFTSGFTTQASQTRPLSVSSVQIFSDAAYTALLGPGVDYPATGTIYVQFTGVDGSNLTRDYTIASLSTGSILYLTETASATAVYRGAYNFSGLGDRFELKAQSVKTPSSSASILITYPRFNPVSPASGSLNVPVNSSVKVIADEPIISGDINATTVKLLQNGSAVSSSRNYNPVTREITITPDALLTSEKTYIVEVSGLKDINGNPQLYPLVFQFTTEDIIPPTITGFSPSQGESNVTIDRIISIDFSENILAASSNNSTVKLTRGGIPASYSVGISGNRMIIDPDDSSESYLKTQTTYIIQLGPSVTDLSGNALSNVPATFTLTFSTQPLFTPPTAITSLTIFKDPLLLQGWSANEKVPASATVFLKVTGIDGATQTLDIATVSLDLSWTTDLKLSIYETASNSSGLYVGQMNLGTIPLYGIPTPQPAISAGSLTFFVDQAPANAATLSLRFPALVSADTVVNTLSGVALGAGATNVRTDTTITTAFNEKLLNEGNNVSFKISSGTVDIAGSRALSSDGKMIYFTPSPAMPFSSQINVAGIYSDNGLKSVAGNPLYREFSYTLTTQASQTQPTSISQVNLFSDNSWSAFSSYGTNDDFPSSGTIFIELRGSDSAANTIDSTLAIINTGSNIALTESGPATGIFRGSYTYSTLSDGFSLNVAANVTPSSSQTLKLTYPSLTQQQPASGATEVSVYSPVFIQANEPLDSSTISSTNIKLLKNGAIEITSAISWNGALKMIEITPVSALDFSSQYTVKINGIRDIVGNLKANEFISSFSTQGTSIPPTVITDLKAYSNSAYSTLIADNATVPPGIQCYFEVKANDLSATTIDSTILRMSSDVTAANVQIVLIETGVGTGVFRGSKTIFNDENANLTITSESDPTFFTRIKTLGFPLVTSLQPASGTVDIFLDTRFSIKTNKSVDATTVSPSTIILSDSSGIVSFTPTLANPTEIIIFSELTSFSDVFLKTTAGLKDLDGIEFPVNIAQFKTVNPVINSLKIYSDAALTTQISNGSQVEVGQTIYSRISGSDAYFYSTESASLTYTTANSTSSTALTEVSPGIFDGSFTVPDVPGVAMKIFPDKAVNLALDVVILPKFAILSFTPASGAISVPSDVWPSWNFTRPVNVSDANTSNFKLTKVSNGLTIPGIISQSPTLKQIRFQPNNILQLLTEYEMSVSQSVRDSDGNALGVDLTTRFVSQPPPNPPTLISVFDNFESTAYATSTKAIATNGTLHLKIVSVDTSFSTYDTARVRIDSSDGTLDGLELDLVEIAPPSGIFTLDLPVNLPVGTTISIKPQVAPDKGIAVKVFNRTKLVSVLPASGSVGLLLDTPLRLSFDQTIDFATTANGLSILASNSITIPFTVSSQNSGKTVEVLPATGFATGSIHNLAITTSLRDLNGLFLLPENLEFSTVGENFGELELLTGIWPLNNQPVSKTGEAVNGPMSVIATTSNLFATFAEFRAVNITAATQTFSVSLEEQPGLNGAFIGTFTPPANISKSNLSATLAFANNPSLVFNLAPTPSLISFSPASNSINLSETPLIVATFSRRMSSDSALNAATISYFSGQLTAQSLTSTDSILLRWVPAQPLPVQSSCTLTISGLTDYLGQPIMEQSSIFSTGGLQGIKLYKDNGFSQLIASDQIDLPIAFTEVAASSTSTISGKIFNLLVRTGTRATSTLSLPLDQASPTSGKFRCSLELEAVKNLQQFSVPLLPGEWLELTSPELTNDKKIFYYRHSGTASPTRINGISFYYEKHFAQPISDILPLPTLYIQADAEDLNWFTTDSTRVKVTSAADLTGISLVLSEAGTHSNYFRGAVAIDTNSSDQARARLLVSPGQRIFVESETDPSVRSSILYLPENSLVGVSAFPSPARGNSVFFRFYLNFKADVELEIYDTSGDEVDTIQIRGKEGENKCEWKFPRHLANGVYFYVLKLTDSTAYPKGKRKARGKFAVLR